MEETPVIWADPTYWVEFAIVIGALLLLMYAVMRGKFKTREVEEVDDLPAVNVPAMDIILHEGAPYEVVDLSDEQTSSTVRFGIKNTGDSDITNCNVYIDAIDPMPPSVEVPIMLQEALYLPHMYPEILVDIATRKGDTNQYRFCAPLADGDSGEAYLVDDGTPRSVTVKVEAAECQRAASFKIWTDDRKRMHIKLFGHTEFA